jgi:hypothetical protein
LGDIFICGGILGGKNHLVEVREHTCSLQTCPLLHMRGQPWSG